MTDHPGPTTNRHAGFWTDFLADFGRFPAWPLLRSLQPYRLALLPRDLAAGLTLAAIAIPEQMATARLGGFAPEIGFFAFMAGSLAFALFGANRFLSSGADSTITPIFAGGLALVAAAGSPAYAALAAMLALMVGTMLVAGGIFRLGWIADLLSVPVTIGFLVGIAAHILVSQLPDVLGLPSPDGPMLGRVAMLIRHVGEANPLTVAIALGVLLVVIGAERIAERIPGALIGLAAATIITVLLGLESRGVAVLGVVAGGLPKLAFPEVTVGQWVRLLPLGFIIALVVMVQTAATTRSFPSLPGEAPDVDADFVGVGAGSILAGLFGAFAVNASPPRTAIVAATGGRSQLAGVVAAAIVLAMATVGVTLLRHVPQAALAGVLLFVALRIVKFGQIVVIYRQSGGEFLLIVATALAIMVLPIEEGVAIGIVLSLLHGVWSTTQAAVVPLERVPGTSVWWPPSEHNDGERVPGVMVAGFPAPLTFLNAYRFRHDLLAVMRSQTPKPHLIVLEATGIIEIDFTAAQELRELIDSCRAAGIDFAVARLEFASCPGGDCAVRARPGHRTGPHIPHRRGRDPGTGRKSLLLVAKLRLAQRFQSSNHMPIKAHVADH